MGDAGCDVRGRLSLCGRMEDIMILVLGKHIWQLERTLCLACPSYFAALYKVVCQCQLCLFWMGFLSRLWHCGLQFVPPVYLWTWNVWTVCLEIKMPGTREPAFKSAASSPCQAYIPGNAEIAKRQIEMKQVDVNKIVSSLDLTYFLCACLSGDGGLVDYMIKKGCNVNHQNKRGFTPLHRAASKGNCKIIKFLLEQGANPNIVNAAGVYPIDSAVCAGYLEAAKLLKIELPNPYVWDVVEPHTPPHITLGLQSPSRREILLSTRSQVFEKVFKEKNKNSFKYS
ncbi:tankyrase-1-like isoform X2 [Pomacea canaliculata]|uniref:tankyrase-1-like isoform X2 n=1 Tax=Pomacea canaliculata TaxID=400727 RepID=UPI000D72CD5B|nr:tankyrase-1-like isoform X2 [Pomacea canaliculata]